VEIEEALTTYLLSQSGLTALIDRRFFYDLLPQGCVLPAVVCQNVSDVKDHTYSGIQQLERPMYQFTTYANSRASARAVAAQIKAALSDYHGTMSGLTVQYIRLENELTSTETGTDGTTKTHVTDLEFEINYLRE
jgi:hypothetical protein